MMHSVLRGGQRNSKKLCVRFSSVSKKKPLLAAVSSSQNGSDSTLSTSGTEQQVAENPVLFAAKDPNFPLPGRAATDLNFYRAKTPQVLQFGATGSNSKEPERSMHEHQFMTLKNLEYYREVINVNKIIRFLSNGKKKIKICTELFHVFGMFFKANLNSSNHCVSLCLK